MTYNKNNSWKLHMSSAIFSYKRGFRELESCLLVTADAVIPHAGSPHGAPSCAGRVEELRKEHRGRE